MPYRGEGSYDLDVQGQGNISGNLYVGHGIEASSVKASTIEGTLIGVDAEVTVDTAATATPIAVSVGGNTLYVLAYPEAT